MSSFVQASYAGLDVLLSPCASGCLRIVQCPRENRKAATTKVSAVRTPDSPYPQRRPCSSSHQVERSHNNAVPPLVQPDPSDREGYLTLYHVYGDGDTSSSRSVTTQTTCTPPSDRGSRDRPDPGRRRGPELPNRLSKPVVLSAKHVSRSWTAEGTADGAGGPGYLPALVVLASQLPLQ